MLLAEYCRACKPELQVGTLLASSSDLVQHTVNVGPLRFAAGQIQVFSFSFTADESLIERLHCISQSSSSTLQVISGRVAYQESVCKVHPG